MPDLNFILEFIKSQYLQYGYVFLLTASFIKHILLVGFLWPGGTIVLIGVVYASQGLISFPLLIVCVCLGSFLGNLVNYWLGRKGLLKVFKRHRHYPKIADYVIKAEEFLKKHGQISIFLSYFVGYLRPFVALLAGEVKLFLPTFIVFELAAIIIYNTAYYTIAFFLASSLDNVETLLSGASLLVAVLIGAIWLVYRFILARRKLTSNLKPISSKKNPD